MADAELVHVIIPLHDDDGGCKTERVWAVPLGNDLYEIRNTPWYAHDVNFGDTVKAIAANETEWPILVEVSRRSGHKTLRIFFDEEVDQVEKEAILKEVSSMKSSWEQASARFYSVDVEPDADYQSICDFLWKLENEGRLEYETGATADESSLQ